MNNLNNYEIAYSGTTPQKNLLTTAHAKLVDILNTNVDSWYTQLGFSDPYRPDPNTGDYNPSPFRQSGVAAYIGMATELEQQANELNIDLSAPLDTRLRQLEQLIGQYREQQADAANKIKQASHSYTDEYTQAIIRGDWSTADKIDGLMVENENTVKRWTIRINAVNSRLNELRREQRLTQYLQIGYEARKTHRHAKQERDSTLAEIKAAITPLYERYVELTKSGHSLFGHFSESREGGTYHTCLSDLASVLPHASREMVKNK